MIFVPKCAHDDSILEVQFYKTAETKSSLKFKPLNSSVEIVESEQITEIVDKPTMLHRQQIMQVKIPSLGNIV